MSAIVVTVLAHNEEHRIGICLASLPLDAPDVEVHVVVNGTTDRTAAVAQKAGRGRVTVHDWPEGGKSRSWNRFLFDTYAGDAGAFIFVDGDAEVIPGSVHALAELLAANPGANAVAGLPCNGRNVAEYRAGLVASHGMFGDLYGLSSAFVARMRGSGIRLPDDLIGDDSLIGAFAKTNLAGEQDWNEDRLLPCPEAGFLCEPARLASISSLRNQYRRMINYSVRHFQNAIVSAIMRDVGPSGLPPRMAVLYPQWLPRFRPRTHPVWWWFDRLALARMRAACAA